MKKTFLKKYQDYCRIRESTDEIFQMVAKTNETLEEYVELFQYNLQRYPYPNLPPEVLKTTMIKGMKYQWVETLNLMGNIFIKRIMTILYNCATGVLEVVQG